MNGQTTVQAYEYFPNGGVFVRVPGGTSFWRHPDWLGTSRFASTLPGRTMYYDGGYGPFGETYASSGTTDESFTGMTKDATTLNGGLYDFMFRKYSPVQGRWISADPAGAGAADPSNPQSWNRYAYVTNKPLSSTDPLGLWSDAIGSGSFFQSQLDASNRNVDFSFDRWSDWNVRQTFGDHYYDLPGHNNPMAVGRTSYLSSIPGYSVTGGQLYAHFGFYTPNPDYDPDLAGDLLGTSTSIDVLLGSVAPAANNGLRAPDFISLNVNVGIPYLLNLVGPTVAVNIGRNGHVYIGPGVNVGNAATFVSGSVTANWMTQPSQMQGFLTKNSFSVDAGYWGGVQGAWTPGSGLAGGVGFVSPQGGGAWTYSFDLGKWFGGW